MTRLALTLTAIGLLTAAGTAEAQRPPKQRPAGAAAYNEGANQFQQGQQATLTRTETVKINGAQEQRQVQVAVIIPERRWMIGVQGWHDFEGLNVISLSGINTGGRIHPSPLSRIETVIDGRTTTVALEPDDVITAVDGYDVTTPLDLFLAIHQADNPRKLEIDFIDHRTGNEMTGTISAVKLRR